MNEFTPSFPIPIQIRKIIFENFNNTDSRFTNDEIFEIMKKNGDIDPSWTTDNIEQYFNEIVERGLVRNIAQNLTTQWFKLFDVVEKIKCNSCNQELYMGKSEERTCPNCKASV